MSQTIDLNIPVATPSARVTGSEIPIHNMQQTPF